MNIITVEKEEFDTLEELIQNYAPNALDLKDYHGNAKKVLTAMQDSQILLIDNKSIQFSKTKIILK